MALSFGGSDEHAMLGESLARLLAADNDFEKRAHRLNATPPDRMALWPALVELGAVSAMLPEAVGGFGDRAEDVSAVQIPLAASLPVEPVLSALIAGRLLAHVEGADDLKEALATGEAVVVPVLIEGFDPFAKAQTTVLIEGDTVSLKGFKPAVRNADVATHFIVGASDADGGAVLVWVPAGSAQATPTRLIDGAGAADLTFDGVCEGANVLAVADVSAALEDALSWALGMLSVETAAIIAAVNALTFEYLNTREQFGTRLSAFQALQHKCADMAIAAEEAAAMASMAVQALDGAGSPLAAVLRASLAADRAGRLVGHTAVQLFGGMGVSDELLVSHHARRLTAIRNQIGTMDARADVLARIEGFQP